MNISCPQLPPHIPTDIHRTPFLLNYMPLKPIRQSPYNPVKYNEKQLNSQLFEIMSTKLKIKKTPRKLRGGFFEVELLLTFFRSFFCRCSIFCRSCTTICWCCCCVIASWHVWILQHIISNFLTLK